MFWDSVDRHRRKLPHWHGPGAAYFVTWSLARRQRVMVPSERDLVADTIRHFEGTRYSLTAWVVMDDHAHAIVQPEPAWPLPKIMHSWKSFTAHELVKRFGRLAPVWLPESYDRLVRNEAERLKFARYIVRNPQRRWPGLESYRWVWSVG
jgi:REP element-mobilizing transposase RayT